MSDFFQLISLTICKKRRLSPFSLTFGILIKRLYLTGGIAMNQEKSCGAVIVTKDIENPKVVLIKHQNGGHWAFPKGHVEGNETEEETALREIMEETHLSVELDTQFRHVVRYSPYKGTEKEVVYFIAYANEQTILKQDEEVLASTWLSFSDALAQITYENDQKILQSAIDYLTEKN